MANTKLVRYDQTGRLGLGDMTSMTSEVVCMMQYVREEVLMKLTSCHLQTDCVELVFRGLVLSPLSALSVTNWLSRAVVYVSKMVVLTNRTFKAC